MSTKQAGIALLVCGSRTIKDYAVVEASIQKGLRELGLTEVSLFVSGGAAGVDQLAERWANSRALTCRILLPDWEAHGRRAGIVRNVDMLDLIGTYEVPVVIAVWDGESRGTMHTIGEAKRRGYNWFVDKADVSQAAAPSMPRVGILRVTR